MAKQRLEIRPVEDGILFYIDGELQFDSRDEYVYHESLVTPAAGILAGRKQDPFKSLILGGGDGLALREILKWPGAGRVDLVDYDEGVLDHAKREFSFWNRNALHDSRVKIHIQDACDYLQKCPQQYDLVILDFTFPRDLAGCRLFSRVFYAHIKKCLSPEGMLALNAISPTLFSGAYWSIFKTLTAGGLNPKPLKIRIPSFLAHGYGDWGFFLGSPRRLGARELSRLPVPVPMQYFNKQIFLEGLKFPRAQVSLGYSCAREIIEPADLLSLLRAVTDAWDLGEDILDFRFCLSPRVLNALDQQNDFLSAEFYSSWGGQMWEIFCAIDWESLFAAIEQNLGKASLKVRQDFTDFRAEFPDFLRQKIWNKDTAHQLILGLLVLMIFVNMVYPDNAFAKGYHHHSHHSSQHQSGTYTPQYYILTPVAAPAFRSLAFETRGVNVVPDMKGRPHLPKTASFVDENGLARSEKLFFALADDISLSQPGRSYYVLPDCPYAYYLKADGFRLLATEGTRPVFEFYPDSPTIQLLRDNLATQQRALGKTMASYEKWLSWANPARVISADVRKDSKEIQELKVLQGVFERVEKEFRDFSPSFEYPALSFRLAPSVYLSKTGSLLLQKSSGTWVTYDWRGFEPEAGYEKLEPAEDLNKFLEAVVTSNIARLEAMDPIRSVLQNKMSVERK